MLPLNDNFKFVLILKPRIFLHAVTTGNNTSKVCVKRGTNTVSA